MKGREEAQQPSDPTYESWVGASAHTDASGGSIQAPFVPEPNVIPAGVTTFDAPPAPVSRYPTGIPSLAPGHPTGILSLTSGHVGPGSVQPNYALLKGLGIDIEPKPGLLQTAASEGGFLLSPIPRCLRLLRIFYFHRIFSHVNCVQETMLVFAGALGRYISGEEPTADRVAAWTVLDAARSSHTREQEKTRVQPKWASGVLFHQRAKSVVTPYWAKEGKEGRGVVIQASTRKRTSAATARVNTRGDSVRGLRLEPIDALLARGKRAQK